MRSLRTVYSAINSEAFSNRSGGIEGRLTSLYICSNRGESSLSATSARCLISLIGWFAGTRFSGFTKVSIVLCGRSYPRIFLCLLNSPPSLNYTDAKRAVDPIGEEFLNILLGNAANYCEAACDGACFVISGSSDDRTIRSAPSAVQRVVNGRRYLHGRGEGFPRACDRYGFTVYEDRYFLDRGFGHG